LPVYIPVIISATSIISNRISAENGLHDMVATHGCSSKIDKRKVQALPCEYASDNIKKPSKQEAQNGTHSFILVSSGNCQHSYLVVSFNFNANGLCNSLLFFSNVLMTEH